MACLGWMASLVQRVNRAGMVDQGIEDALAVMAFLDFQVLMVVLGLMASKGTVGVLEIMVFQEIVVNLVTMAYQG